MHCFESNLMTKKTFSLTWMLADMKISFLSAWNRDIGLLIEEHSSENRSLWVNYKQILNHVKRRGCKMFFLENINQSCLLSQIQTCYAFIRCKMLPQRLFFGVRIPPFQPPTNILAHSAFLLQLQYMYLFNVKKHILYSSVYYTLFEPIWLL